MAGQASTDMLTICTCFQGMDDYHPFFDLRCAITTSGILVTMAELVGICPAVVDEPCQWYSPQRLNPRHPEWGSGYWSENYQDSSFGDDPHMTCEYLITHGDEQGNSYSCERNFCATCGANHNYCDAYCGYCRSMADPSLGDFPGSSCVTELTAAIKVYDAHCTNCATVGGQLRCTPQCDADVTYTEPCDMCENDSGFGSNDCDTLVGMGVSCTRDLGVLASAFAGVLLQDRCQVTCGVCTCPLPQTVNCNADVVQGGLMHVLLESCFQEEDSLIGAGYNPYIQCAREAAAVCQPLDCLNLYYDVRDACSTCGFPAPLGGAPQGCEAALSLMENQASSCTGVVNMLPDMSSPQLGRPGSSAGSMPEVASQTRAACLGCDLDAVYKACGRPTWSDMRGTSGGGVWDTCSPECGHPVL